MNKITMIDIAKELGVSKSTVSRAFNPDSHISQDVRSRVLQYAKENNFVPNRAASRLSMKEINIGMLYPVFYSYAFRENKKGIKDGYLEMFDLKVNIDFFPYETSEMTVERLRETLLKLNKYDGLIVNGFTDDKEIKVLNEYAKSGVKLVVLQSDVPTMNRLFASCNDPVASSSMAAEYIKNCLACSQTKNVVLFTGDRESDLHMKAQKSFCDYAFEFGLNVVKSYDMKDSPEILEKQIHELYEEESLHPDAIYITSGESISLCQYLKENNLGDKTILVTFDVYPELATYLDQGIINATIYQNHYKQGKNAFTNLVKYLIGQCDVHGCISPVPELVMKSNLGFYLNNNPDEF